VEDLKLGLDLALSGYPPIFCPSASVTSNFPSSVEGVQSQRLRWEQGHIGMILSTAPSLILAAIVQAKLDLLALAFDVTVMPLSLLGMLVVGMSVVAGLATLLGISSAAMLVSTASLAGLIGGVFLSWLAYGRDVLPPSSILLVFSYVFRKLPLYRNVITRKSRSQWTRTDRGKT